MPTFENFESSQIIHALYEGDPAAGKTGSTASLAAAGYDVRLLDLDKKVEVLKDYLLSASSIYRRAAPGHWTAQACAGIEKRFSFVTIEEEMHIHQGAPIAKATAWGKITSQLNKWTDGTTDLGSPSSWTPRVVLVIDGLTKLVRAAWNFQLKLNGRLSGRPEQSDYFNAQNIVREALSLLKSLPCHVIVICHLEYIENDATSIVRGYPKTIGRALSPELPGMFSHVILARSTGQGAMLKRRIITTTVGTIDLMTPAPLRVKPEYDLETGLADYFFDVLGHGPNGETTR